MVATYYFTKFAEVHALKSSVKHEVTRFLYEQVFIRFGTPLEIVSYNGPQFLSEVVENLLARLAVKHRFTTMYKPSTNGLVERTNRTLCSMLAKEVEVHVNICDWDLKVHHVCVGLQHHIQNCHMVLTFSFNLWDGSAFTH